MKDRNKSGGNVKDNLDKWVKNATTENFNKLKYKKSELQSGDRSNRQFHGNVSQERKQFTSSRDTRKESGPLPLIIMVVLVIIIINKIVS